MASTQLPSINYVGQLNGVSDEDISSDEDEVIMCQLKTCESRFNSKGERITLSAGLRKSIHVAPNEDRFSALILTKVYDKEDELQHSEMEIRSMHMKAALREVAPSYPGVNHSAKRLIVQDCEKYLFHYHKELQSYKGTLDDARAMAHIDFLLQYLYKTLHHEMRSYQNHVESLYLTPVLNFSSLWMIFRPGDLVYQKTKDAERIYRLVTMSLRGFFCRSWFLTLQYTDYDGTQFGTDDASTHIQFYDGYKAIEDLSIIPLKYHPKSANVKEKMVARGRKFVAFHGRHHCEYDGVALVLQSSKLLEDDYSPMQPMRISGRIIVDAKTCVLARPSEEVCLLENSRKYPTETEDHLKLTEEELLICKSEVMGFSLVDKRWCYFKIDCIKDIEYNKDAFESLLLQKEHKEMVRSLVTVHEKDRIGFDDVVKGKGHGMIFLLHGVPGVGKTLTAESVAEVAQRPLYTLSAGELGVDPVTVEQNLSEALRLATIWKAIVLMDEADVLLEQRTHNDLKRNSLVSVFLRVLEYYEGIMILTTNRVGSFDSAFKSRIHFTIKYPSLSLEARRNLWSTFLAKAASEIELEWVHDESTLDRLAVHELNGREIKNVVQTAYAYSISMDVGLKLEHVEVALKAMREFDSDFAEERTKLGKENSSNNTIEDETGQVDEPASKKRKFR